MLIPLWHPICLLCDLNMELFSNHIVFHIVTTVEQLDSQSKCLIEQLQIVLRTSCNECYQCYQWLYA